MAQKAQKAQVLVATAVLAGFRNSDETQVSVSGHGALGQCRQGNSTRQVIQARPWPFWQA